MRARLWPIRAQLRVCVAQLPAHLICSGGYVLGFRVDPPDRLKGIYKEIQSLHQVGLTLMFIHLSATRLSPSLTFGRSASADFSPA